MPVCRKRTSKSTYRACRRSSCRACRRSSAWLQCTNGNLPPALRSQQTSGHSSPSDRKRHCSLRRCKLREHRPGWANPVSSRPCSDRRNYHHSSPHCSTSYSRRDDASRHGRPKRIQSHNGNPSRSDDKVTARIALCIGGCLRGGAENRKLLGRQASKQNQCRLVHLGVLCRLCQRGVPGPRDTLSVNRDRAGRGRPRDGQPRGRPGSLARSTDRGVPGRRSPSCRRGLPEFWHPSSV